jgi:peptidoglycan-associated lipoprotein
MKKNLSLIGIFAVLVFGLAIFTGCAEKKTVVTAGSAQEQKVAAAQTADTTKDTTKEQSAKVRAAETAVTVPVSDINFDFDKSNIRSDAREILKTNADVFLKNSASTIVIEGYCDERGTAEYNMALGQRNI